MVIASIVNSRDQKRHNSVAPSPRRMCSKFLGLLIVLSSSFSYSVYAQSGSRLGNVAHVLHSSDYPGYPDYPTNPDNPNNANSSEGLVTLSGLQNNPFKKPEISQLVIERPTLPAVTQEMPWQPELKATLVGGLRPAVNIDGSIVYIGDTIQNYVLVDIREREAVFEKEGVRRTLKMEN